MRNILMVSGDSARHVAAEELSCGVRLSRKSVLKVIETSRPVVTQVTIGSVIPASGTFQKPKY